MTLIRFSYQQTYHVPATGTVVFMPHRRHAANETEILPKPFHRVLVDGETTVDLEPTAPTWVWSVTHNDETLYYAIPDQDGVINHVDLVPIAPSTLPTANNAVEPAWWAEHRNTNNLIQSLIAQYEDGYNDAMSLLRSSATDFTEALEQAARHESVAGAYSRQAQASNEQAWQASKAPDGAAARAQAEADRAEIYRDETDTHRIAAVAARDESVTVRDESVEARDESVTARNESVSAAQLSQQHSKYVSRLTTTLREQHNNLPIDMWINPDHNQLLPLHNDMSSWSGWGSSGIALMADQLHRVGLWFRAPYYDGAKGGERYWHTEARLGSNPARLTFPDNTIPSTTTEMAVTSTNVAPLHAMKTFHGSINGVHGTLRSTDDTLIFNRTTPGDSVHVEPGTPFIPDDAHIYRNKPAIIQLGKNNLTLEPNSGPGIIESTDRTFDWFAPQAKRIIVIGHHANRDWGPTSTTLWNRLAEVNDAARARYGQQFFDLQQYMVSDDVWYETGIDPTVEDLEAQEQGSMPPSLSRDHLHFNETMSQAIVQRIENLIYYLDWFPNTKYIQPPTMGDDFNRADGELTTISSGNTQWVQRVGIIQTRENKAVATQVFGSTGSLWQFDSGKTTATITMTAHGVGAHLYFSGNDEGNGYIFGRAANNRYRLYTRISGQLAMIGDHPAPAHDGAETIRVDISDNHLRCIVNDEPIIEHTENIFQGSHVGIRLSNTEVWADDLYVHPLD